MVVRIATLRGPPLPMVRAFLEELGGRAEGEDAYAGEGWRATLSLRRIRAFIYGFHEVTVRLEGEAGAVERVLHGLRVRAWRGGAPKD